MVARLIIVRRLIAQLVSKQNSHQTLTQVTLRASSLPIARHVREYTRLR